MTTTPQARAAGRTAGLRPLRGNCMGAAVLLVIQFGWGTAVNICTSRCRRVSRYWR